MSGGDADMKQSAELQFMKLLRDCQRHPGSRVLRMRDAACDPSLPMDTRRYARACAAMEEADGGPGSGNHGHAGRPGQIGGSAPGNGGESTSWTKLGTGVKVNGPRETKKFIKEYSAKHPEVLDEAKKYRHVRSMVMNFQQEHPNAEPGTYSATTGKPVEGLQGYCVTFHQNHSVDNPFGDYSDEDYAIMCSIAKEELGCDDVNIGYFGNAEVSFTCSDERKAKQFAVEHNQHSIYNSKTGRTMLNKHYYNPETNPIDL